MKRVRVHCGPLFVLAVRVNVEEVCVEYCLNRRRKGCGFDMVVGCAIARCVWRVMVESS